MTRPMREELGGVLLPLAVIPLWVLPLLLPDPLVSALLVSAGASAVLVKAVQLRDRSSLTSLSPWPLAGVGGLALVFALQVPGLGLLTALGLAGGAVAAVGRVAVRHHIAHIR